MIIYDLNDKTVLYEITWVYFRFLRDGFVKEANRNPLDTGVQQLEDCYILLGQIDISCRVTNVYRPWTCIRTSVISSQMTINTPLSTSQMTLNLNQFSSDR